MTTRITALLPAGLVVGLTLLAQSSLADDYSQYSGHLALGACQLSVTDTQNPPDFSTCSTYVFRGGYRYRDWLTLEGGFQYFNESETERETDLAGSYETAFSSGNFLVGGEFILPLSSRVQPYARLGLLHYGARLTVHEYFEGAVEDGKDTGRDSGFGYYSALGLMWKTADELIFTAELQQQTLQDVFADSARPFDANYYSLMLGIGL